MTAKPCAAVRVTRPGRTWVSPSATRRPVQPAWAVVRPRESGEGDGDYNGMESLAHFASSPTRLIEIPGIGPLDPSTRPAALAARGLRGRRPRPTTPTTPAPRDLPA